MNNDNDNDDKNLMEFIRKNPDGFTIGFNLKKPRYKNGFYVGLTNNINTDLTEAIKTLKHLRKMFKAVVYCGGWLDKKDNLFYLDLSKWIKDKSQAVKMAKTFKQLSVWDIAKQEAVYI